MQPPSELAVPRGLLVKLKSMQWRALRPVQLDIARPHAIPRCVCAVNYSCCYSVTVFLILAFIVAVRVEEDKTTNSNQKHTKFENKK